MRLKKGIVLVSLMLLAMSPVAEAVEVWRVEETDPSFVWTGSWESEENPLVSGGTFTGTSSLGDKVDITFTGTGIALIYATTDVLGIANVVIDGVLYDNIDMYSPGPAPENVVFQVKKVIATGLTNTRHVLTINCSGTKNPASRNYTIVVDAVDVYTPSPAAFTVSNLVISHTTVEVGKPVTITVDVTNTGDLEGTYNAILRIDGVLIENKDVTVAGGATETVTFSPVTKDATGTYTVDVGGQTKTFEVRTPAAFVLSNLVITQPEVELGKSLVITVDVTNTGGIRGTHSVTLIIDNVEVETIPISVAGGATEAVSFTVVRDAIGTYSVAIDNRTGTFAVTEPAPTTWVPIIAGILALIAIIGGVVVYLIKRK